MILIVKFKFICIVVLSILFKYSFFIMFFSGKLRLINVDYNICIKIKIKNTSFIN